MAEIKDYYKILGIDKTANEDDIKKAYRKLAAKYHPDRYATSSEQERKDAEEKFKEINEANSVLSDKEKRANYDQFGDPDGGGFDPFGGGFDPFQHMRDFFSGKSQSSSNRGDDDQVIIYLTFQEAYNGCLKEYTFNKKVKCSHCNGTGSSDGKKHVCSHCNGNGYIQHSHTRGNMMFSSKEPCPYCHGTGKDSSSVKPCEKCHGSGFETIVIKDKIPVPAGVQNGMAIVLQGQGHESSNGGPNGDLQIVFAVNDDERFERHYNDLYSNVYVNLEEAWCGCEKNFTGINGEIFKIKIPELSENGKLLRLSGKGWPNLQSGIHGDLYLRVVYVVPKSLSKKQKELLKEFYKN